MRLFSAHHAAHEHTSEFGDEIFGQTAKLDDFGRMIIDQELHVGKLQIVTDELILTLNTAKAREEWELIEKSITSIFCLEIKD